MLLLPLLPRMLFGRQKEDVDFTSWKITVRIIIFVNYMKMAENSIASYSINTITVFAPFWSDMIKPLRIKAYDKAKFIDRIHNCKSFKHLKMMNRFHHRFNTLLQHSGGCWNYARIVSGCKWYWRGYLWHGNEAARCLLSMFIGLDTQYACTHQQWWNPMKKKFHLCKKICGLWKWMR